MKQLLTILLLAIATTVWGQDSKQLDSVTFCFTKYKVPTGCEATGEYQVLCGNNSISWMYFFPEKQLKEFVDTNYNHSYEDFQIKSINPYLLKKKVKGYKTRYKSNNGIKFQIVAYGVVNNQPVLVLINLDKEAKTNDDIPEFARKFVTLTK